MNNNYTRTLMMAVLAASALPVTSFTFQNHPAVYGRITTNSLVTNTQLQVASINSSGKGFAPSTSTPASTPPTSTEENEDIMKELIMKMKPTQIKEKLLDLLPRMTGTAEEFATVESYVNALEDKFVPPQTLDFLNLAMVGEWQFLFTTNQLGRPSPRLRLTELIQKIEVSGFDGKLTNKASWDLAQDGVTFDARGSFASATSYKINQGARMTIGNDHDLKIELSKGSVVPNDTQELVGLIHRAMPTELFDSTDLAMDTTYLDTDIKIVRFTGARHEGVRNIFMRKGLIEINPSGMDGLIN